MERPSEVYVVKQKIDGANTLMTAFYSMHDAYSKASKLRDQYAHVYINYIDCIDMERSLKESGECFLWKNISGTNWIKVFVLKIEDSKNVIPWLTSKNLN
jgi:hypothetical protein